MTHAIRSRGAGHLPAATMTKNLTVQANFR